MKIVKNKVLEIRSKSLPKRKKKSCLNKNKFHKTCSIIMNQ